MPVVKGGVWTNIEDEILKASVSKYGLNQWARVSSLLARKTPKQCKARWTEWLDPSIKKIEWSRDEDEKLLHLAKIMPTQWRTIAPIVGRTANQCLERYQRLLDEAEAKESAANLGLMGADGAETKAPTTDDVRRLRSGDLDPDPETKPAKPDTVDLDEDEKEMLSEARARLANTQGKKAKRKARERQQEESRRLAALQKRRELKTAGINIKIVTRKPGQMDYNADIPFERQPAPGFYDTTEEQTRNEYQRANFDPKKAQLATKRKGADGDEAGADTDRKRRKNEKDTPSAALQAAMKAGQMQRLREAEQSSKRRALVLPSPQVGEGELEEIVKMGSMGEAANRLARAGDNDATRGLVTSYSQLNTNTPIRTPMAPAQDDHIATELRNIRAQSNIQSVLLGGEEPEIEDEKGGTGFDGIAPRKHVVSTPNPMATPFRQGTGPGATPLRPGATPMRTPRDGLALNSDDGMSRASATPRDLRTADMAVRNKLKQGLASLPKPKDLSFDLTSSLTEEEEAVVQSTREEDAAERDRRNKAIQDAENALERRRRTQVMQRNLPRPVNVNVPALMSGLDNLPTATSSETKLILREAALLIFHDATKFRIENAQIIGKAEPLETFSDDALAQARLQILMETKPKPESRVINDAFNARNTNSLILGLSGYDDEDDEIKTEAICTKYNSTRTAILSLAEADAKLETKLARHLGGYQKRQKMLRDKISAAAEAVAKASRALDGFRTLAASEQVAVQRRLEGLRDEVGAVSRREREAQEQYRRATDELAALSMA